MGASQSIPEIVAPVMVNESKPVPYIVISVSVVVEMRGSTDVMVADEAKHIAVHIKRIASKEEDAIY